VIFYDISGFLRGGLLPIISEIVEKGSAFLFFFHQEFSFSFLLIQVFQEVKLFPIIPIFSFKNRQLCVI